MAISGKDIKLVKELLQEYPEIVHPVVVEYSPLHDACQSGDVEMVKLLIEHGADPNATLLGTKYEIPPLTICLIVDSAKHAIIEELLVANEPDDQKGNMLRCAREYLKNMNKNEIKDIYEEYHNPW
jgi:ankyrin repeat protein